MGYVMMPIKYQYVKYGNRKIYNRTLSRYETIVDIFLFIKNGYDVRITDSKTKNDITPQIVSLALAKNKPLSYEQACTFIREE